MPRSSTRNRIAPPSPAPRFGTPRDPDRPTIGPLVAVVAEGLGRPLHPHQRWIVDVAGEVDPDTGLPAYPDVGILAPRRAGKTVTVLARILRALREGPQVRAFYTAQGSEDATKVLRDEWFPLVNSSAFRRLLRFRFARGDAGMYVKIGPHRLSRCEVFTPNANALHGRDSDLTVVDEAWAFTAERGDDIDAGIRPARWARPASQIWRLSAGGTPASGYLHRLMDAGREARAGLAYFEWSADPEAPGYDPYDEALWWATHPGLGRTCSIENIRADAATMPRAEFERALLCVWPRDLATTLVAGWDGRLDPEASPSGPLTLAFDVNPERTAAAIAIADQAGAVEVVDHHPGTRWLAGRIEGLCDRHDILDVVRDRAGPAGATHLDVAGVRIHDADAAEVAEACAWLTDAIAGEAVRFRPHPGLAAAFGGARARNSGDGRQVWVRRLSDADLSPLYAVTLAAWRAGTTGEGGIF